MHLFMTPVYLHNGYFKHDNVTSETGSMDSEFSVLHRPPQSPALNPVEHLWDVLE